MLKDGNLAVGYWREPCHFMYHVKTYYLLVCSVTMLGEESQGKQIPNSEHGHQNGPF